MNILVIGNGFDIAHHLPTQYRDFLDFVKAVRTPNNTDYSKFISELKKSNHKLYSEIETLANNNVLIDYFLSIYEDRCKNGKKGWIDFESEISGIVKAIDEAKKDIEQKCDNTNKPAKRIERRFEKVLNPLIAGFRVEHTLSTSSSSNAVYEYEPRYFDNLANWTLKSLNRMIRLLEIYLHEYVEKAQCVYRLPDIEKINIDHILSFNYTDTFKRYYDPEGKAQYCFVHGKATDSSAEDCNLVLGIDEYLPPERINDDNQFVWFKKFYQRIYKETGSEYLDWLDQLSGVNKMLSKAKPSQMNLFIYGHSLDVTDKDVLSKLILMKDTKTHIFYHDRDSMARQINNLVKVIGEENLIRMTGGKGRSIVFIQSKPAVEVSD